jgi:hypothetical protein
VWLIAAPIIFLLAALPATARADDESVQPPQAVVTADATVIGKDEIQDILGKKVSSSKGQDMGQIVNVIVDHRGHPLAMVVDFGGFLGVGSRKIAVDWNAFHFVPDGKTDRITLDLTPEQLKAAPEYQEGKPVVVIVTSGKVRPLPSLSP